jgi:hypothetical protein
VAEGENMKAKEIDDFDDILDQAEANANSDWEMNFTADMREKYEDYGGEMFVSEKQLEHLERIAER